MKCVFRAICSILVSIISLTAHVSAQIQNAHTASWDVVWVNTQPAEEDIQNPNIWMAGTNRYTGIAYDRWNDVLYIVNPDMCQIGAELYACPKIYAWDAETGQQATRIVHAQNAAPAGQLYVDPNVIFGGMHVRPDEAYDLFRIDLDDEGRIYACNLGGTVYYPYLRYDPLRIYRWDTYARSPIALAQTLTLRMLGSSFDVVGKRRMVGNELYDSTRIYLSGGQEPPEKGAILNEIFVYTVNTGTTIKYPFYNSSILVHNEAGSYMAAHGIAATSHRHDAMLYMDSNSRPVILNQQTDTMALNQIVNPILTGDSGPIKYYLDTLEQIPYLICADGLPSTTVQGEKNTHTSARVVQLSGNEPFNWPAEQTPSLGDSTLHNFWGPDNWVSDVDYKIWTNPITGHQHLQLFVLMSNNGIGCFRTHAPLYYPVEMETFRGFVEGTSVRVFWQVAAESNNKGFEVQRSFDGGSQWESIGFVSGRGTASSAKEYSFLDPVTSIHRSLAETHYRLRQIDFDGAETYTGTIAVATGQPESLVVLYPHSPQPVQSGSGTVRIQYWLPESGNVTVTCCNALGENRVMLLNDYQETGMHCSIIDVSEYPPGLYFYHIHALGQVHEQKLIILR